MIGLIGNILLVWGIVGFLIGTVISGRGVDFKLRVWLVFGPIVWLVFVITIVYCFFKYRVKLKKID